MTVELDDTYLRCSVSDFSTDEIQIPDAGSQLCAASVWLFLTAVLEMDARLFALFLRPFWKWTRVSLLMTLRPFDHFSRPFGHFWRPF